MKEIKWDLKSLRDTPYFWIGTLNIVKMSIFPKLIYRFDPILIKISEGFFVNKFILKLRWKNEVPIIANTTLQKKKKNRRHNQSSQC